MKYLVQSLDRMVSLGPFETEAIARTFINIKLKYQEEWDVAPLLSPETLIEEKMKEFSLTDKAGKVFQFASLDALFDFVRKNGEIDGWILRVHYM